MAHLNITSKVSISDLDAGLHAQLSEVMEAVDANLKEVATVVRDDAKHTADFIDKTRNLRKSIGMRKSKFPDGGYIVKASGRNRDTDSESAKGFHAHLVEFGHVMVLWGKRTGEHVPAIPFMRKALARGFAHALKLFRQGKSA